MVDSDLPLNVNMYLCGLKMFFEDSKCFLMKTIFDQRTFQIGTTK